MSLTLTLSLRFMYPYGCSSAGRGDGRGAMPFLMSFALEHEIVTFAWIDNASVQFPLNIYATKGFTLGLIGILCCPYRFDSDRSLKGPCRLCRLLLEDHEQNPTLFHRESSRHLFPCRDSGCSALHSIQPGRCAFHSGTRCQARRLQDHHVCFGFELPAGHGPAPG